jgi:hypothetical protein
MHKQARLFLRLKEPQRARQLKRWLRHSAYIKKRPRLNGRRNFLLTPSTATANATATTAIIY